MKRKKNEVKCIICGMNNHEGKKQSDLVFRNPVAFPISQLNFIGQICHFTTSSLYIVTFDKFDEFNTTNSIWRITS